MDPDTRSYGIAAVVLLCVVAGVAAVGSVLANVPSEPKGDGMPTFFAAVVLAELLLVTLVALLEAVLLAGLVRWTDLRRRPRYLLEVGALVGGVAGPLHRAAVEFGGEAIPLAAREMGTGLPAMLIGFGLLSTGFGVLVVAVGPLSKTTGRLLVGALVVVLAGAVAGGRPTSEGLATVATWSGTVYGAVGLYALVLAALLAVAVAVRPDAAHWPLLPLALVGIAVAVLEFLTESFWLAAVAALSAVVTLWAFRALAPWDGSAFEEHNRGAESRS